MHVGIKMVRNICSKYRLCKPEKHDPVIEVTKIMRNAKRWTTVIPPRRARHPPSTLPLATRQPLTAQRFYLRRADAFLDVLNGYPGGDARGWRRPSTMAFTRRWGAALDMTTAPGFLVNHITS
jgi:hypothetical protein